MLVTVIAVQVQLRVSTTLMDMAAYLLQFGKRSQVNGTILGLQFSSSFFPNLLSQQCEGVTESRAPFFCAMLENPCASEVFEILTNVTLGLPIFCLGNNIDTRCSNCSMLSKRIL